MLGGTLTVNAVNGKATFTNLTINMVGTGYTLTASSGTLTAATIPGINVAAATAARCNGLDTTKGTSLGGTQVTIYGANFTATAVQFGGVNATSYTVNADNVITAVSPAGTAGTTVDITVTTPGGTSPQVGAATFLFVSPNAGPATQLMVMAPPASVTANATFGLTVNAEDGSGNTDSTYIGPVTLALSGGTSGAVLGGTVTVNAVNGVATFTGLTINTVGTGYTLSASSGTLTSATSSIDVTATAAPSVTGLSTSTGPAADSTPVTIYGANFTGATAVQFGGVNATSFTVNADNVITAVSPAGTAGTTVYITVTTPEGTSPDASLATFQYT